MGEQQHDSDAARRSEHEQRQQERTRLISDHHWRRRLGVEAPPEEEGERSWLG
jgi:hypothetical protein